MASDQTMEMEGTSPSTASLTPPYKKSNKKAQVPPFPLLVGEFPILLSKTVDGNAMITNFRFCVCERRSFINLPLMMIGEAGLMETSRRLKLACKDGATYACTFATSEDSRICTEVLRDKTAIPSSLQDIFAFKFHKEAVHKTSSGTRLTQAEKDQAALCQIEASRNTFDQEVIRLGFDTNKHRIWKMSYANENFEFCPTYPKLHVLPATMDDEKLKEGTDFRAGKRFPSVVWRDRRTGVVLIRSSQPLPSFLGLTYFSNEADVFLLEEIVKACVREREILFRSSRASVSDMTLKEDESDTSVCTNQPTQSHSGSTPGDGDSASANSATTTASSLKRKSQAHSSSPTQVGPSASPRLSRGVLGLDDGANGASPCETTAKPLLAIVDCRSRAMIWGNSFKGGGTEDEAKYKCSIIHLDLPNIHTVRDSFNKLRALCHSYVDGSYFKSLSGCMWLTYISALLRGANIVVELMYKERRPVLVHCSDGWDRTSQIVSLAEMLMDPYYRTIEGFQILVEREWLQFGHKFGERGGHDPHSSDVNQQSPVFLQFLDCVYQLTLQYPAHFQFNEAYLVKLLKHSQACLFGTFLHNSERERQRCPYKSASLWSLLKADNSQFINLLYSDSQEVLTAHYGEHDIILWKSVYMAGLSPFPHSSLPDFCLDPGFNGETEEDEEAKGSNVGNEGVSRSRSVDDLSKINTDNARRNSDPNIAQSSDSSALTASPVSNNAAIHDTSSSSAEIISYPDDSPPCGSFQNYDINGLVIPAVSSKDEATMAKLDNDNVLQENTTENDGRGDSSHSNTIKATTPEEVSRASQIVPGHSDTLNSETNKDSMSDIHQYSSPTSVAVDQDDISSSSPTQTLSAKTMSYAVLSSDHNGISPSENGDVTPENSDPVVLDSNGFSTSNNPKTDNSPSDSKPRLSSQDGRMVSLLSERLAEDDDRKHRVVNGTGTGLMTPSSPSSSAVNDEQRQPLSSSSSPTQHSKFVVESGKTLRVNPDDRKILDLKRIAQQQFQNTTKAITASHSVNIVSQIGQDDDDDGNTTPTPHSDKVQQRPIPITTRSKAMNGHALNGHSSSSRSLHQANGVDANAASTDTLVETLDDALKESTPFDQTLDLDISDVGYFTNTAKSGVSGGRKDRTVSAAKASQATNSGHPSASAAVVSDSAAGVSQGSVKGLVRRARTASGASRDLSVSPCYSCGWMDAGRLRHQSGGESSTLAARRSIAASVSTSTSDISDSFVGKINPPVPEKQMVSVRQHLDVDSLTLFSDRRQDLLAQLVSEKDRKIAELESRLGRAIEFIRANRNRQILQQQQVYPVADELLQNEPEGGEHSSLGTISNPASDASWEQLDESEEKVVLWVPDDVVTHCAGCDKQFWFYRRKHHCRNCGKIFCFECRNYLAPMPNLYMKEPQRVCRRCHSRLMQLSPGASSYDGRIPTLVADG